MKKSKGSGMPMSKGKSNSVPMKPMKGMSGGKGGKKKMGGCGCGG